MKKRLKQVATFVDKQILKNVTNIVPYHFHTVFDNLPDEIDSSTVNSITEDKKSDFPTDYYKLSHFLESEQEIK